MPDTLHNLTDEEFNRLKHVIKDAGEIALSFFVKGAKTHASVSFKNDHSPVSQADIAVDCFLSEELAKIKPEAGWLSEEKTDDHQRLNHSLVWVVDPIDGTRAFIEGIGDWVISIALVNKGRPIAGLLWAPALSLLYEARAGAGAFRNGTAIKVSTQPELSGARVAGPAGMLSQLISGGCAIISMPREPSLALRLARVADASLDAGIAAHNARDWDLAAAELILQEAGGKLCTLGGKPVFYNKPDPVHDHLISANCTLAPRLVAAFAQINDTR